jgi:antitoxin component of RelBE/YafQ-DinJ toxin-antitoxin module
MKPKSSKRWTTGSKSTRPVQFRIGAEMRARAETVARARGLSVGQLAKLALEAELAK